jgi:hypothetical protein
MMDGYHQVIAYVCDGCKEKICSIGVFDDICLVHRGFHT